VRSASRILRVLVMDDEPLIRDILSYILRNRSEEKIQIVTVATGAEALNEIRSGFFDLCFLDVNLPDMSGLRVMERIKTTANKTKVVVMTGSEITEAMRKQISEGADIFIEKPFDLSRIREVVKAGLIKREPTAVRRCAFREHIREGDKKTL
jgi:DNA-binding NtrC family response regulator